MQILKTKKHEDVTVFMNEKICSDCGGDGCFEIVVPQENYIIGTQEIFEKEECQKCNGKGVIEMDKEVAVLENRISELEDVACTQSHLLDERAGISDPLYKLAEDYENAFAELTPMIGTDDEQFAIDTLNALQGTVEVKSISVAKFAKRLEAFESSLDEEIKRLKDRKRRMSSAKTWLKNYLKANMIRAKLDKIETALFTLRIVKNPPRVNVIDTSLIPERFIVEKYSYSTDKTKMAQEMKAGTPVPGAELIQETRLEIK